MMMLSMIQDGEQVEIVYLRGGHRVRQRLEAMGFVPGVSIHMVTNQMGGPAIVKIKDSRVAVGRGMLHHILVQPPSGNLSPGLQDTRPHSRHFRRQGKRSHKFFKH
ncbi:MAG: ferrous iron transport protein A [Anaerolineaceae bacterium]|nr:ferrous iron transport protein A [Anaerolineaceae bacterium]